MTFFTVTGFYCAIYRHPFRCRNFIPLNHVGRWNCVSLRPLWICIYILHLRTPVPNTVYCIVSTTFSVVK
jgi:hypothetical protein